MGFEFEEVKELVVGTWDVDKGTTISKGQLDKEQSIDINAFDGYIKVTKKEFKFLGGFGKEPTYKYRLTFDENSAVDEKYYVNTIVDGVGPKKQGDVKILDDNTIIYTDYGFPYSLYLVKRTS